MKAPDTIYIAPDHEHRPYRDQWFQIRGLDTDLAYVRADQPYELAKTVEAQKAEIDTLASDCNALSLLNQDCKAEIARLRQLLTVHGRHTYACKQKYGPRLAARGRGAEVVSDSQHAIPVITNPMGRHWHQPSPDKILVDDKHALMDQQSFEMLPEYSSTFPTGVYVGKMWRRHERERKWLLCWYGPLDESRCSIEFRQVLIA